MMASPSAPPPPSSWPDQATDLIVQGVGTVRDKTVGPAMTAARGVVYGLFAAMVGVMSLVLFCIFFVRLVVNYLPGHRVWAAEMLLGVLFCIGALPLWARARKVPHR